MMMSGNVQDHVMAAYISHGPDGDWAFPAGGSTAANRINTGSTDADTLTNGGVNSSFASNFTNVKVQKERTTSFDDLLYYPDYHKNTCCIGESACQPPGIRIDGYAAWRQISWLCDIQCYDLEQ